MPDPWSNLVVIDRHSRPHTLRPGERKPDVELPNKNIANFRHERRQIEFSHRVTAGRAIEAPRIELSLKGWRRCFRLATVTNDAPR